MNKFVKGYKDDAGIDIVLEDILELLPGLNVVKLPCTYTPAVGEVAFLVPRSSTAVQGIFPIMVAIDANYTGEIHGMIVNVSDRKKVFLPGDRVFGIVNLKLGESREQPKAIIAKEGSRTNNWNNSSGGNK